MPYADDVWIREELAKYSGVEGSWADRRSFLRSHALVRDTYRHAVVAAREASASYADGDI